MKPDRIGPRPLLGHVEPAHLQVPGDRSHQMWRYLPSAGLEDLVGRYWIPVWSLPDGEVATQRVLQHPVPLLVIEADRSRFSGVASGLSSVALRGRGFAVGVLFRPAAGFLVTGQPMVGWTDRAAPLDEVLGGAAGPLVAAVREAMHDDPGDPAAHRAAIDALEGVLARWVPVDAEGRLANDVVDLVESHVEVVRVAQVCAHVGLGERALQRLTRRRLGISPKWIIRRRRLHEATEALRTGRDSIGAVAARLGYADQSHLTRDVRAVTGLTPAQLTRTFGRPDRGSTRSAGRGGPGGAGLGPGADRP